NRRPLLAPLLVGAGAHHTPLHVNRDVVSLGSRGGRLRGLGRPLASTRTGPRSRQLANLVVSSSGPRASSLGDERSRRIPDLPGDSSVFDAIRRKWFSTHQQGGL